VKPIDDLIKAWELHYSTQDRELRYTKVQRNELGRKYAWIQRGYANVLYDQVVTTHPMSLRSLPDMAVITEAMKALDRPEVYADPSDVLMIEDATDVGVSEKMERGIQREVLERAEKGEEMYIRMARDWGLM
jgi:hypothetical protein